jgi:hypothetical protein
MFEEMKLRATQVYRAFAWGLVFVRVGMRLVVDVVRDKLR